MNRKTFLKTAVALVTAPFAVFATKTETPTPESGEKGFDDQEVSKVDASYSFRGCASSTIYTHFTTFKQVEESFARKKMGDCRVAVWVVTDKGGNIIKILHKVDKD